MPVRIVGNIDIRKVDEPDAYSIVLRFNNTGNDPNLKFDKQKIMMEDCNFLEAAVYYHPVCLPFITGTIK